MLFLHQQKSLHLELMDRVPSRFCVVPYMHARVHKHKCPPQPAGGLAAWNPES